MSHQQHKSDMIERAVDISMQQFGAFGITIIICCLIIISLIYLVRQFWNDMKERERELTEKIQKISLAATDALIKNAEAITKLSERIDFFNKGRK